MDMTFPHVPGSPRPGLLARLAAPMLGRATAGSLLVHTDHATLLRAHGPAVGPQAQVHIHRRRALLRALLGGEQGAARAFILGEWSSPDLTEACRFFARNPPKTDWPLISTPRRWLERARHAWRANTRSGSRRNIEFHYDLGNDFFRLWLDDSMAYSSALWRGGASTLEAAQRAKLVHVADLLGAIDGRSVLEIGCGWGAQARELASRGARVKGITLSPSQLAFAQDAIATSGYAGQVTLHLQDYRDQAEQHDAVVSIEMAEAVGEANLPTYFDTIRRSLKPGGKAVLQVITIAEENLDNYRANPDFIQRFVFPGGYLPSKTQLHDFARQAGLQPVARESFGLCYARTLAEWRSRFDAAWPRIAALGFDERFRRLWTYYLCYCEAGFREGLVDVGLYVLARAE
ncbi:MAG: cyclopropane-fatty-acyl-phospholipid synthase family protein [Sphingomonadales bacterium]|nr:cyclopropane-fatty-acyl-phospholipid synthase family protein [Sphingomonadales bacterium]